MTITEVFAIIGIALVATTVAVTAVIGGDMLRREWLRKRRWKRMEREAEERRIATPSCATVRNDTSSGAAAPPSPQGEGKEQASVSTGLAMTEEETEHGD